MHPGREVMGPESALTGELCCAGSDGRECRRFFWRAVSAPRLFSLIRIETFDLLLITYRQRGCRCHDDTDLRSWPPGFSWEL